jgi:Na+-driven multidrug efflux pump
VDILLGDPKKAVIKLSIPIIVAMSVQTIYSLTDTFRVSGFGADALAAVGFSVPFTLFVEQLALALTALVMNYFIVSISNTDVLQFTPQPGE